MWKIETDLVTNPMASFEDDKKPQSSSPGYISIDLTQIDSAEDAALAGIPVKRL